MQEQPNMQAIMRGKICLITGGSGGIGKEAALALARQGATVVIVSRNAAKTAAVSREIQQHSGNPHVEYLVGDLSLMAEVRRIAAEFRQRHNRLDVLINNAGAIFFRRQESVEGLEKTFALNHLSPFLLTNLLVDLLIASAPSRIITVSSGAHLGGKMHFPDPQFKHGYPPFGYGAYAQSKLANVLFTYELARRLEGTGVTANALHPGFVNTNFGRSNGGIYIWVMRLAQLGAISAVEGAQTIIYLASSPDVEGVSGQYFQNKRAVRSSSLSYDEEAARRLWDVSLALTGLKEHSQHAPA